MAELRLLTARQLRQVYRERVRSDFPPSERRPLASMERLRAAGVYDTWGMYEGEELLAYAFLWRSEAYGVALLDYLAVCREGRGRGTGTLALSLLQARYGGCSLLVEAEAQEEGVPPEENALRARRLSFYERSGFRRLDYQTRIFGVQYAGVAGGGRSRAGAAPGRPPGSVSEPAPEPAVPAGDPHSGRRALRRSRLFPPPDMYLTIPQERTDSDEYPGL
jgi:GNAT superfamily N-acetyltransferase